MATMYRLPRNAICAPCHEGAKSIIAFLNKDEQGEDGGHGSAPKSSRGSMNPDSAPKARVPHIICWLTVSMFISTDT